MSPIQSNIESRCEDAHGCAYLTGACIPQGLASYRRAHLAGAYLSGACPSYGGVSFRGVYLTGLHLTGVHLIGMYPISIFLVSLSYGRTSHERAPPVGFSRGVHLLSSQSLCPLHLPQSLRPLPLPLP